MNKSEKRNFLGSLKNSKRRNSFLKLFESLNKSDEYDSKALQSHFENLDSKELKEMKYRLQEKIIAYLATYDMRSGPRLKIEQFRVKALVLEKRGFIKEAIVNFEKARKLAERYEFFSELFIIYPALTRYYLYFIKDFQSIKKGLAIVKIWSAYATAYAKNQKLRIEAAIEYRTYLERNSLLAKHEDIENYVITRPSRFTERTAQAEINLFKAINKGSEKKILQAYKQSLKVFEESAFNIEANIIGYTSTLINAISQSISINRFKDLNHYKASLEAIRYSGPQQKMEGRQLKYYGLLVILLIQSDLDAFQDIADAYKKDTLIQSSQGDIVMRLVIQSLFVCYSFVKTDYDQCWKVILDWLQMEGEKFSSVEELIYIKCMLAICQFECGELDQCKRTLHSMSQQDFLRSDDKRLLRFIRAIKTIIESLIKADKYKASIHYVKLQNSYVYNAFQDYLLVDWLESKIKLPADVENRILNSKQKGYNN